MLHGVAESQTQLSKWALIHAGPKVLLYGFFPLGCVLDLLSQFILTKCGNSNGLLLHRFSYKKTVISSLFDTSLPPSPISLSLSVFLSLCGSICLSMLVLGKQADIWWEALWKSPCGKGLVSLLLGFPGGSAGKESACNAEDLGSISGSGRSPGEGIGYPLQ